MDESIMESLRDQKFESLKVEKKGHVVWLTLSRPQALNALNKTLMSELSCFLEKLQGDFKTYENLSLSPNSNKDVEGDIKRSQTQGLGYSQMIRCLVVTGEGKSFVAGADIKEMEEYSPEEALAMSQTGQHIFSKLESLPIPTIACVNGFALGGGLELALSCDFILASEKAKFGLPEVGLGLIPGYGGTQRLSRVCGKALAKRIALSGEIFSADDFFKWGIVVGTYSPEALLEECDRVAKIISEKAPRALNYAKQAIHHGYDMEIAKGLEWEAQLFSKTFATKDHEEGIAAFLEKRAPQFQGQ